MATKKSMNGISTDISWIKTSLSSQEKIINKIDSKLDKITFQVEENKNKIDNHLDVHDILLSNKMTNFIKQRGDEIAKQNYKIIAITGSVIGIVFTVLNFLFKYFKFN